MLQFVGRQGGAHRFNRLGQLLRLPAMEVAHGNAVLSCSDASDPSRKPSHRTRHNSPKHGIDDRSRHKR
ncbi:MAG: hypothetical protein C0483_10315 [Pirellula sp.]|nr:hypothetical protein [Pirellula sp.]